MHAAHAADALMRGIGASTTLSVWTGEWPIRMGVGASHVTINHSLNGSTNKYEQSTDIETMTIGGEQRQ